MQNLKTVVALALACCTNAAHAGDKAPTDPDLGDRIVQAAVYDGKLWLMGAPGSEHATMSSLVSLDLATNTRTLEDKNGTVALHRATSGLWVLRRQKNDPAANYVVSARSHEGWTKLAEIALYPDEHPIALTDLRGGPAIVTSKAIRFRAAGKNYWTYLSLEEFKPWGMSVATASLDGSQIYLGFDRGEWGGGLMRIDVASGGGKMVEKRGPGLCEGDLNSDCSPVTGIVPDPEHPACVIVSWGLAHFTTSGRILRVCGDEVQVVHKDEKMEHYPGGDFPVSDPFFALAPAPKGFWTVSYGSLLHFEADTLVKTYDLPELRPNGGIWMSREIPGVIVIRTDANWGMSLSGYTPLIVPADGG